MEHIYIIDDDESFGKSLKRLLSADGFTADYFSSAQSFFDSVPPEKLGCAIVDFRMPECDGFSLIDKMHALRYTMRIIVITGRPQSDSLAQALSKGALGLLQKPFSEASLLELLNKV
jgi:FixJ family two-component response regulator